MKPTKQQQYEDRYVVSLTKQLKRDQKRLKAAKKAGGRNDSKQVEILQARIEANLKKLGDAQ